MCIHVIKAHREYITKAITTVSTLYMYIYICTYIHTYMLTVFVAAQRVAVPAPDGWTRAQAARVCIQRLHDAPCSAQVCPLAVYGLCVCVCMYICMCMCVYVCFCI